MEKTTVPSAAVDADDVLDRGVVVGKYVVLDELGRGGMGSVFAAYDSSLDRRIALKFVRAHDPGLSAHARLVDEARAMARIHHPNIVTVHEVGIWRGRLFIAMELVDGATLDVWLLQPRPWREILRVLVQAGRALEAAHIAGVVHRDFKPNNVLVDGDRARVTDFGIAQFVDDTARTGHGSGTPEYMSPEQRRCEPTDARSDQFSFCATARTALADGPRKLRAIIERGLAESPIERWPSMTELLHRLERLLRPARTPWIAAAGAAVALATTAGLAIGDEGPACAASGDALEHRWQPRLASVPEASRAAVQRYLATLGAARTEACRATHVRGELSTAALDLRTTCLGRREAELDALVSVLANPEVRGRADAAIAELLPVSSCTDVAMLAEVVPPPERARARVDEARREHAAIKALLDTGQYKVGFERAERARDAAREIGYAPLVAEAEFYLGKLAWRADRPKVAEASLYAALAAAEAGRDNDISVQAWLELLWFVGQEQRRYQEALRLAVIARGAIDRYPRDKGFIAAYAERVGVIALDQGDLEVAERHLEEAYALRRSHFGARDPQIATSLHHLGLLALARSDFAKAVELQSDALAIFEAALGPEHPHTLLVVNALAASQLEAGKPLEALELFRRALAAVERTHGPDGHDAGELSYNLALVYTQLGRHDEAIAHHLRAIAIAERIDASGTHAATRHHELAHTFRKAQRFDEAIAQFATAIAIIERVHGPASAQMARALTGQARSFAGKKLARQARSSYERAIAVSEGLGYKADVATLQGEMEALASR